MLATQSVALKMSHIMVTEGDPSQEKVVRPCFFFLFFFKPEKKPEAFSRLRNLTCVMDGERELGGSVEKVWTS